MMLYLGDGGEEREGSEKFEKRSGVPKIEGNIMQKENKPKC